MSLLYIGQQITIYVGIVTFIAGIIGNGINILVFSNVRSYRQTSGTFYFLIASIFNIVYISICFTSRIVMSGFGIDLTQTSSSWCKIRQFSGISLILCSLSCSCLATIDQFFATSQSAYLRSLSNIKLARRNVCIITVAWFLHAVPILFVFDISLTTKSCRVLNYDYNIYYQVVQLGHYCIIPVVIMTIFGYLSYYNMHQIRILARQQIDRQLIRMILFKVILAFISFIPNGINNAYSLYTAGISKDINQLNAENFATTIIILVTYFYFSGSCYMFLISSNRFRQATKNLLSFHYIQQNQVYPTVPRIIKTSRIHQRARCEV